MKDQLIARWRAFSSKEQSILMALSLIMLVLLIYAFLWLPVQHGRERLSRVLPEKKLKLMMMRSQAGDIESLRRQFNEISSHAGGLKAAIEVSAKVNGLTPTFSPAAQNNDANRLAIVLTQVSFDNWLKWVESLQSQHHVRVQSCKITPNAPPGLVNIDAVFTALE